MAGVVKSMDAAMRSMNLEKVGRLATHFCLSFDSFDRNSNFKSVD